MDSSTKSSPPIVIYSSPTCGYCHMVKEYLKEKGQTFVEKDISVDQDALNYVLHAVGQAVTPIITIGDSVIVGFDRPKIDEALGANANA